MDDDKLVIAAVEVKGPDYVKYYGTPDGQEPPVMTDLGMERLIEWISRVPDPSDQIIGMLTEVLPA